MSYFQKYSDAADADADIDPDKDETALNANDLYDISCEDVGSEPESVSPHSFVRRQRRSGGGRANRELESEESDDDDDIDKTEQDEANAKHLVKVGVCYSCVGGASTVNANHECLDRLPAASRPMGRQRSAGRRTNAVSRSRSFDRAARRHPAMAAPEPPAIRCHCKGGRRCRRRRERHHASTYRHLEVVVVVGGAQFVRPAASGWSSGRCHDRRQPRAAPAVASTAATVFRASHHRNGDHDRAARAVHE